MLSFLNADCYFALPRGVSPTMRATIVSVLLLLTGALTASAQPESHERAALRGVTAVGVVVEQLDAEVKGSDLTNEQIQAYVELRLRKAGIRVLDQSSVTLNYLYVNVNAVKANTETFYAVNIHVEFKRYGRFGVDKDAINAFGSVWSKGTV